MSGSITFAHFKAGLRHGSSMHINGNGVKFIQTFNEGKETGESIRSIPDSQEQKLL
jgi:hypothetical protein